MKRFSILVALTFVALFVAGCGEKAEPIDPTKEDPAAVGRPSVGTGDGTQSSVDAQPVQEDD